MLSSNLTILVLCIVIIILGKEVWDVYQRERLARESLSQAQVQKESLDKREQFLRSEIDLLENQEGVESELRERYGIAKPGEKVIVLVDAEATTTLRQENTSWWKKIFFWLR
ncbi:MAG: hypothetical protein AMXMBFR44_6080 [Candidatus Campbellbacteria bacterium]